MSDPATYRDELLGLAHPDGGWGYVPGQPAHLEPTCLGLLALAANASVVEASLNAVRANAAADGTYRLARGRDEAVWPTALVLFTRAALGDSADEIDRTAGALLGIQGRPAGTEKDEVHDIDLQLIGWPWADGNFSWVEPTAWAVLALRRAGLVEHPRVQEGIRLLLDRAFDEGGVNYGNRRVLGRILEPIPGPTALMLLALQGLPEHPRIHAAVDYLTRSAPAGDDLEHLCWARLALDLYRGRPGVEGCLADLGTRIRLAHQARLAMTWLRPAPLRLALTALALNVEHTNPFRLPALPAAKPMESVKRVVPSRGLGDRVRSWLQGFAIEVATQLRQPGHGSDVHIAPVSGYGDDLAGTVRRQYEHFRGRVPLAGKRVVLKPNLVEYHRDKVINTHANVVAAVIELCQREGAAEVLVAEGPGHHRNVEYLVSASGLGDVLRTYKVPFVDLNHDEPIKTVNLGRLTKLGHLFLTRTISTADVVVSIPKLKTHHWAIATLSLKNLFGTLPGICYGWPKNELHWRGIDNSIVDIAATRTPDLAVVDGVVGMEGDGPLNGTPRETGVLVMGTDLVAVDATCCRLMMLDPARVPYLVLAQRKRLGLLEEAKIRQIGETLEARSQPFAVVPHFEKVRLARTGVLVDSEPRETTHPGTCCPP